MFRNILHLSLSLGLLASVVAQDPQSQLLSETNSVKAAPPILEMVRINDQNVFFIDDNGLIGVAKFDDELNMIAWDYYNESFRWEDARHLAVGRNLSVVSGSPHELTQGFDTDRDGKLDFFQDTITQWPGKTDGAYISCGPIADSYGRLLFAIAPAEGSGQDPDSLSSSLISWNPRGKELTILATSSLPIAEMTVSQDGMIAAWVQLPSYKEGYYLSLEKLPEFDPSQPDLKPEPVKLVPNIIIPAELTKFSPINQMCFIDEHGTRKVIITCPDAKRIIEVRPELHAGGWGGFVTVRDNFDKKIYSIEAMKPGRLILGGEDGFINLGELEDGFRFDSIFFTPGALNVRFNRQVDRAKATALNGIRLSVIPLEGKLEPFPAPEVFIESDGLTAILPIPELVQKAIIKIDAPGLTSEEGLPIASPSLYYTVK